MKDNSKRAWESNVKNPLKENSKSEPATNITIELKGFIKMGGLIK